MIENLAVMTEASCPAHGKDMSPSAGRRSSRLQRRCPILRPFYVVLIFLIRRQPPGLMPTSRVNTLVKWL
jgi:hypothetical protein